MNKIQRLRGGTEAYVRALRDPAKGDAPQKGLGGQNPTLEARINHGRWLVDCPRCNGAQRVDPADPWFFCVECGDPSEGWQALTFPTSEEIAQIEAILEERPAFAQNWFPGESPARLRKENDEHETEVKATKAGIIVSGPGFGPRVGPSSIFDALRETLKEAPEIRELKGGKR